MRSMAEREERQLELRERHEEKWPEDYLTLKDCARMMNVSRSTAYNLFRPVAESWRTPGSHRPILRVRRSVFERTLRRKP